MVSARACTVARTTAVRLWTARRACGARISATAIPGVAALQRAWRPWSFAPTFQFGHNSVRARLAGRCRDAGRPEPRVLRDLRLWRRLSRAQDRACLSPACGEGERTRLIGRERAYHGVGFGGIRSAAWSRTGAPTARCCWASTICARRDLQHNAFSRGQPDGARISPATSSGFARCTTPRRSPR